jgi:hypothetical protein
MLILKTTKLIYIHVQYFFYKKIQKINFTKKFFLEIQIIDYKKI